nr:hypothetical protein [Tanacetum cinerariifolium]
KRLCSEKQSQTADIIGSMKFQVGKNTRPTKGMILECHVCSTLMYRLGKRGERLCKFSAKLFADLKSLAGRLELSDNQSLLLQYSRDGYVIEGELKEYEDSCEKSSVQIKFEDKDFIQDFLKIQVAQKKIKLAFENADFEFESGVDTFRD